MKSSILPVLAILALSACAAPNGTASATTEKGVLKDVSTAPHSGPNDTYTNGAPDAAPDHPGMPSGSLR